ncbi:MAG: hypothetical protein II111_01030 [Oscillospiraceae bacterium]|nr:hypothetical protein [Oscillospiraceae bacterium]MBQ2223584.1 hypothetical protein [Oscillospiraceae bacterium]MBQ5566246.1 hypothetical protein [Oscillospiraceae bacterium]
MSRIYLLAADKPLPLCDFQEMREHQIDGNLIVFAAGFAVSELEYYREAVEELELPLKPYRYGLSLEHRGADLRRLTDYLRENLLPGEEVELCALWLGGGPGKLRRYRGTLEELDMDALGMLFEGDRLFEDGQVCLTVMV